MIILSSPPQKKKLPNVPPNLSCLPFPLSFSNAPHHYHPTVMASNQDDSPTHSSQDLAPKKHDFFFEQNKRQSLKILPVTILLWLSDPQLGYQKVTLNHLERVFCFEVFWLVRTTPPIIAHLSSFMKENGASSGWWFQPI